MELKVVAERKAGFDAPIGLEMVFDPPGVSSARGATIPKGQSEGAIRMNANGNAQVREWKIAVAGSAPVAGATVWASSQLATLRVAEPYVVISLERSSVEQGQKNEVYGKVEHRAPFDGKATVRLLGLPHKVTTAEVEITRETRDITFPITTDPESPPGNHKNLFCQVTILENEEPMVHSTGRAELRIDKPLPPPKNAPPPKPEPVAKKPEPEEAPPPKEKRLSRLEKLRLEHARRVEALKSVEPAQK
jgi:hypothetical protein